MVISFVSGCFFACVYLIVRALLYTINGKQDYFFYTLFSDFIHPSYFAMYLIMASAFILLLYNDWFKNQKNIRYSSYFFVTIFSICVFLCSSKIGLISFFVCTPIVLIKRLKINFSYKSVAILTLSGSIVLALTYKLFPESFSRLNSLSTLSLVDIDKTSTESTAVRVLIWQQSLTIIQNNLIVGTGVGDANDELYLAYKKNGLTGALSHHLNAHSQYFQTFIGMGMIGFGILLLLTFGQLMNAVIKKNYLLIIFSILIVLNFLVESMLQTAAGILFFTLFYSILTMIKEKDLQVD